MLKAIKEAKEGLITKTSIILGLGEKEKQIYNALRGISYYIIYFL